jgi:hypothetical protein
MSDSFDPLPPPHESIDAILNRLQEMLGTLRGTAYRLGKTQKGGMVLAGGATRPPIGGWPGARLADYTVFSPSAQSLRQVVEASGCTNLLLVHQPLEHPGQFSFPWPSSPAKLKAIHETFVGRIVAGLRSTLLSSTDLKQAQKDTFVAICLSDPSESNYEPLSHLFVDIVAANQEFLTNYLTAPPSEGGCGLRAENVLITAVPTSFAPEIQGFVSRAFPAPVTDEVSREVAHWTSFDRFPLPFVTLAVKDFTVLGSFQHLAWMAIGRNLLGLLLKGGGAPVWHVWKKPGWAKNLYIGDPEAWTQSLGQPATLQEPSDLELTGSLESLEYRGADYGVYFNDAWAYTEDLYQLVPQKGVPEWAKEEVIPARIAISLREAANIPLMKATGMNMVTLGIAAEHGSPGYHIHFPCGKDEFPDADYTVNDEQSMGDTANDDQLRATIRLVHQQGLSVMLKLLTLPRAPDNPEFEALQAPGFVQPFVSNLPTAQEKADEWNFWWREYFRNYANLIRHYGRIAAEEGVEWLCIGQGKWSSIGRTFFDEEGVELDGWRDVLIPAATGVTDDGVDIPEATDAYKKLFAAKHGGKSGKLTYGSNWREPEYWDTELEEWTPWQFPADVVNELGQEIMAGYKNVTFWDKMDAIGISFHSFVEDVEANLQKFLPSAVDTAKKLGKKVILTGAGCCSTDDGWSPQMPGGGCHCGVAAEGQSASPKPPQFNEDPGDCEVGNHGDQAEFYSILLNSLASFRKSHPSGHLLSGLVIRRWGPGSEYAAYPPLILPSTPEEKEKWLDKEFIYKDVEEPNYDGLLLPAQGTEALEPKYYGAGGPEAADSLERAWGGEHYYYGRYPYDYTPVGKLAQLSLYLSFWGILPLTE